MALAVAACNTNTTPAAKACCEQPEIPAGVAPFTVVADEATGPSDGQKVILRVALGKPTKRDDIYPVLHTLYRHAMKRGPFEPIQFIADVYPSEATAKAAATPSCWPASAGNSPRWPRSVRIGSATTFASRSTGPSPPAWAGAPRRTWTTPAGWTRPR